MTKKQTNKKRLLLNECAAYSLHTHLMRSIQAAESRWRPFGGDASSIAPHIVASEVFDDNHRDDKPRYRGGGGGRVEQFAIAVEKERTLELCTIGSSHTSVILQKNHRHNIAA